MATDHIRYDLLAQNALRGVVRQVLADAAREGLLGDHHFYISFKTQHPGVRISDRLIEKFPEEITVILQHQFWDLAVTELGFEVGMSFGGASEKLAVPFEAVTGFFDPSVQFGLKFEVLLEESEKDSLPAKHGNISTGHVSAAEDELPHKTGSEKGPKPKPLKVVSETAENPADPATPTGEKIISLDTFRKKK